MRLLALFAIIVLLAPEAMAADMEKKDPAQEIVYRTNLGRTADVQLLIKKGVSPDQTDNKGTPLIALAAARKDKEGPNVLKALLNAGADINAKDAEGQNALFYAVRQANKDVIQLLLDHGIGYYATDNKGNIARTLAFQQGNQDIVEMMDKFVSAQTEKVNEQYKEYNRQIEDRNKQIEAQAKAAMEEAERIAKQQAEAAAPPKTETDEYLETLAPKESTQPADKRGSPEFETEMRNFSFQNCAFQYWAFCKQVKQRSDLSPEEMRVAIDTHREQVMAMFKSLMTTYQLEKPYLDTTSNNAMQRINDNLEDTHSNTYRLEHGVCLLPDLQTRCTDIAETWNQAPLKKKKGASGSGKSPKNSGMGGIGDDNF